MSRQHQFITLTEGLARTLIQEIQAVLDGEASYFHAELWTDSGLQVGASLVRARTMYRRIGAVP